MQAFIPLEKFGEVYDDLNKITQQLDEYFSDNYGKDNLSQDYNNNQQSYQLPEKVQVTQTVSDKHITFNPYMPMFYPLYQPKLRGIL